MEFFDIVDEKGIPTGESIERTQAHKGYPSQNCPYLDHKRTGWEGTVVIAETLCRKRQLSGEVRYFFRRTYSGGGRAGGICNTGTLRRTGNPGI